MVERATLAGFRPDDTAIALTENSSADWSLGMGIRQAGLVDDPGQRDA